MIPAERQRQILHKLSQQEIVTIGELTDLLGVSHMTVRRDIGKLEAKGRVFSVSGGVQLTTAVHVEITHAEKRSQNMAVKRALGVKAAELIPQGATIFIDAGTTNLEIAHHLVEREDVLVVTNDFLVAGFLAESSLCGLYFIGGKVMRDNLSCVGGIATDTLSRMNFDLAFVSASCWDSRGISSPNEAKMRIKRIIEPVSKQMVLVSDSSKYGKTGAFLGLTLNEIDVVISDIGLGENCVQILRESETELIQVEIHPDSKS